MDGSRLVHDQVPLFVLETTIRRRLALWVILQILIEKLKEESRNPEALCLLVYLQRKLVVKKSELIALFISRGRLAFAPETHDQSTEEETVVDEDGNYGIIGESGEANQSMEETRSSSEEIGQTNQEMEDTREEIVVAEDRIIGETGSTSQGRIIVDRHLSSLETDNQLLKRRSDWWVNTRNIMAMVAIMFATMCASASFAPPLHISDVKVAEIIFTIAIQTCLMISLAVLFFLFGVTATSAIMEQRMLQLANFGLWISLVAFMVAFMTNVWVAVKWMELRIYITISSSLVFFFLASFYFSRRWRIIVGGRGILKESVNDVAPYVLGDMSSEQEYRVEV